jgi:hypothetical protein
LGKIILGVLGAKPFMGQFGATGMRTWMLGCKWHFSLLSDTVECADFSVQPSRFQWLTNFWRTMRESLETLS